MVLKYLNNFGVLRVFILLSYLFINSIFILKYGNEQNYLSNYALIFIYCVLLIVGILAIHKFKKKLNEYKNFAVLFGTLMLAFFGFYLFLSYFIDPENLNVDRWSAMEVSIKAVLNLEYPYDKLDHMQGTSSNFPGLIYIGMPFYLLGNVGLLQPFVFLIGMVLILKSRISNTEKLTILFLLISSVAYLWEVTVRSDLMSNLLIVCLFMFYWARKHEKNYFEKPILLSFLIGLLVLTRGIVMIPLLLLLFRSFFLIKIKEKLLFVVSFLCVLVLLSLPILLSLPERSIIAQHNPFNNQTMHAPFWVMILFIAIPFIISFFLKGISQVMKVSFLLIASLMFFLFFRNAIEEGFEANILGDLFDISYLGAILPFAIFAYIYSTPKLGEKSL